MDRSTAITAAPRLLKLPPPPPNDIATLALASNVVSSTAIAVTNKRPFTAGGNNGPTAQ
ncbi:hypothetical protein HDU76_009272, partial [Blyttiomyces sp. JEL0837]